MADVEEWVDQDHFVDRVTLDWHWTIFDIFDVCKIYLLMLL